MHDGVHDVWPFGSSFAELIFNNYMLIIEMNKFEFLSDEMFKEWKMLEWMHDGCMMG